MEPKPAPAISGVARLLVLLGVANCAWLNRLKNSARKFKPMFSQGSLNCLMTEKSVLTKSGPVTGSRLALPRSPRGGSTKHAVLNHSLTVWGPALGLQPATMLGRMSSLSLPLSNVALIKQVGAPPHWTVLLAGMEDGKYPKVLLSTTATGKPEVMCSMTVTCQLPKRFSTGRLQSLPNLFTLPNGKS